MAAPSPLRARHRRWLAGLLLALLAGCGSDPTDELSGHFGPGSGGLPLSGSYQTVTIAKDNGEVVGTAQYDQTAFAPQALQSSGEFADLLNVVDSQELVMTRITGRPDTPCRFQAALLARDQGFKIGKSGKRRNDQGLDFYEVQMRNGSTHMSLFCTTLHDDVGTIVTVTAANGAPIDTLQVHFLLNSIRKE